MNYWLVKSEPYVYSYSDLVRDKQTFWDGVRNYAARNNLRAMQKGDLVFFYHSNEGLAIVGIAKVAKEAYPDPTAEGDTWSVVDLKPVRKLKNQVTLDRIKAEKSLAAMELVVNSRLSVQKVGEKEWNTILKMAEEG